MRLWTGQSGRSWNDEAAEYEKAGAAEPALFFCWACLPPTWAKPGGWLLGRMASAKLLSFFSTLPVALGSWWPSLHPLDLAVGLCCGAGLRLAVYLKGKNAKRYRHNVEYGSARMGHP